MPCRSGGTQPPVGQWSGWADRAGGCGAEIGLPRCGPRLVPRRGAAPAAFVSPLACVAS